MDTDVHIPWIVVAISVCVSGCQEGSDTPEEADPCEDPTSLTIQAPAELETEPTQVASLVLDELALIDAAGARDVSGLLSAVFVDVTNFVEETTLVSPFGPACVARVGEPETSEGLEPMTVDAVVFSSDVFGERSLTPDGDGRLAPIVEETIFSAAGGETVDIAVTSTAGDMSFPAFDAAIAAPAGIETTLVETTEDTSLLIEWVPSSASYMEIKLTAESENTDLPLNRLRCFFLEDDGCFVVPMAAMEWLTSQGPESVTLRIERHSFLFVVAADNALAEIDAMRSIEFDINVE